MTHTCHVPGCSKRVPPEMLMCKIHWFKVPYRIRQRVWRFYREGQCDDKSPSREWAEAAQDAIRAVT